MSLQKKPPKKPNQGTSIPFPILGLGLGDAQANEEVFLIA